VHQACVEKWTLVSDKQACEVCSATFKFPVNHCTINLACICLIIVFYTVLLVIVCYLESFQFALVCAAWILSFSAAMTALVGIIFVLRIAFEPFATGMDAMTRWVLESRVVRGFRRAGDLSSYFILRFFQALANQFNPFLQSQTYFVPQVDVEAQQEHVEPASRSIGWLPRRLDERLDASTP
jgi:hypothetical protein